MSMKTAGAVGVLTMPCTALPNNRLLIACDAG
jgi:hypothetical protein